MQRTGFINRAAPVILVAEEDPDQSDLLKDILEHGGYCVETAFSGDTAYAKMLDRAYDLVILDIHMSGLNGGTVLKAYRARQEVNPVPIIVVSASAGEADMLRYKEDGADGSLAKPFKIQELLNLVGQLVRLNGRQINIA